MSERGSDVPALVRRAEALAREVGFPLTRAEGEPSCCLPEVGRLLAVLAASRPGGRIAELGTGVGYGTAWLASGASAGTEIYSAEINEVRAGAAQGLLAEHGNVRVVHGDAFEALPPYGPYDLVFRDAGDSFDGLTELAKVGGIVVIDDLTPGGPIAGDAKREFAFGDHRLVCAEILVTPEQAVLLCARTR